MAFEIIDTHLHVYDLKLKASFPNQNWTIVDFPDPVNEKAIAMDATQVSKIFKIVTSLQALKMLLITKLFNGITKILKKVSRYFFPFLFL